MSGSVIGRPGMQAMLKFLRSNRKKELVVIIDDISRLARGLEAHLQLRGAIASAGATLESPSIEFGEDSDSVLVENLLASVSQHQRQKNGEQTKNRMRGRMLNGYWVFKAPWGYRFQRQSGGGKLMVPDEPLASIIKEGLEGFASGRFASQAEVKRFFEAQPEFPKCRHGVVLNERVNQLLTQTLFSGYLEFPEWNVSLRKGQHEGLISLETFELIQKRLKTKGYAITRKDLNEDFPLRGVVCCADCGQTKRVFDVRDALPTCACGLAGGVCLALPVEPSPLFRWVEFSGFQRRLHARREFLFVGGQLARVFRADPVRRDRLPLASNDGQADGGERFFDVGRRFEIVGIPAAHAGNWCSTGRPRSRASTADFCPPTGRVCHRTTTTAPRWLIDTGKFCSRLSAIIARPRTQQCRQQRSRRVESVPDRRSVSSPMRHAKCHRRDIRRALAAFAE